VGSIVADLKTPGAEHHYSIWALVLLVLSYPIYHAMRRPGYEQEGE